ncbi:MAG: EamA family transporter [Armatimonadetes bacterium]|nr:EamA family transporter [Armatimonadota bacterium]
MNGIQSGVLAFVLWGLVPLFWSQLHEHNAWELVAHRAAWSFPLLLGVVLSQRRGREFLAALKNPKLWGTTLLLSANWLLYIYLTTNKRFVEASLGYFIVPLLNTLLGVAFLGERLRGLKVLPLGRTGDCVSLELLWLRAQRGRRRGYRGADGGDGDCFPRRTGLFALEACRTG